MSLSVCAISNQPLEHPVASLKTGHLFEKATIQKHLSSFPYCPITNQPMNFQDLVDIVAYNGPYTRQDQSPITYLSKLQHEYDTLTVDIFKLRQNLNQTQQQITSSLYQNESANRVIAKLLKQNQDTDNQIMKLEKRVEELTKQK